MKLFPPLQLGCQELRESHPLKWLEGSGLSNLSPSCSEEHSFSHSELRKGR